MVQKLLVVRTTRHRPPSHHDVFPRWDGDHSPKAVVPKGIKAGERFAVSPGAQKFLHSPELWLGKNDMGVSSSSWGYPNSWMSYFMENSMNMDDN